LKGKIQVVEKKEHIPEDLRVDRSDDEDVNNK